MNTKQFISCLILLLTGSLGMQAQSTIGLSVGTNKNDIHTESLWYQQQISDWFSTGVQLRYGGIRYRFVNARTITKGSSIFAGIVLGFRIANTDNYRLDFNLTPSYRYIRNNDKPELPSNASGLEIDPNIIFSIRISDQFSYHGGVMMRTAMQFGPEPILNEQSPAAVLLNAINFRTNQHNIALRTYAGPMSGATGDTEKFFWQFSLGYQYNLNADLNALPFFNF